MLTKIDELSQKLNLDVFVSVEFDSAVEIAISLFLEADVGVLRPLFLVSGTSVLN